MQLPEVLYTVEEEVSYVTEPIEGKLLCEHCGNRESTQLVNKLVSVVSVNTFKPIGEGPDLWFYERNRQDYTGNTDVESIAKTDCYTNETSAQFARNNRQKELDLIQIQREGKP